MDCEECGDLIQGWGKRFCSLSCSVRNQRSMEPWPIGYCEFCGAVFSRKKDYRKRYCSRSCSAKENNKKRSLRNLVLCPQCKASFRRAHISIKFCSRQCSIRARHDEWIERWMSGEESGGTWRGVSHHVKRWLRETFGERCSSCGWSEVNPATGKIPVQVDHLDGDPYNHRPENLRLLCPNCHSLTPSFGNLNKGNGRRERYQQA